MLIMVIGVPRIVGAASHGPPLLLSSSGSVTHGTAAASTHPAVEVLRSRLGIGPGAQQVLAPPPDIDDINDYATRGYDRLGITAAQLEAAMPKKCKDGTLLPTTVNGVNQDGGPPWPTECDRPAWLPSGQPGHQCYGHSYIQKFSINGTKGKVIGALICRHKNIWSDDPAKFDDIAMIVHNKVNGETLWFQTDDATPTLDGTDVPAPHKAAAVAYWLKPSRTASFQCIRCHDNGAWMNSRWLDNAGLDLNDGREPYVNGGFAFSTAWKPPKFVTVAYAEIDSATLGSKRCTACHKISQADKLASGTAYRNAVQWLPYSIGALPPTQANATGNAFSMAYWMPVNHLEANAADWKKTYLKHVNALRACIQKKGVRDPANPSDKCALFDPANPTAAPQRASRRTVSGLLLTADVSGGSHFEVTGPPDTDGGPYSITPGSTITLDWQADSNHPIGVLEVTVPSGVAVGGIHTGTNWGLAESPQVVGPLTVPGLYRFDFSTDDDIYGNVNVSLTFSIAGQSPTVLSLQAIVDTIGAGMAFNYPPPNRPHVDLHVDPTQDVYLGWSADVIVPGTCQLTETIGGTTGSPLSDESGFLQLALTGRTQRYCLSCQRDDGSGQRDSVDLTIHALRGVPACSPPAEVSAGNDVSVPFCVTNLGASPDTFAYHVEDPKGWIVAADHPLAGLAPLGPGAQFCLNATVRGPGGCVEGESDSLRWTIAPYDDPQADSSCTTPVTCAAPTTVQLSRFEGVARVGSVVLKYRLEDEGDVAGVFVYRAEGSGGGERRLTEQPLVVDGRHAYEFIDPSVRPRVTYFYRLGIVDAAGKESSSGIVAVQTLGGLALGRPLPNPSSSGFQVTLSLPERASVRVRIYDVRGRLLRTLLEGEREAGESSIAWNGQGQNGRRLGGGIYYLVLETGNRRLTEPFVVLR